MTIQHLQAIAGQVLSMASTVPYSPEYVPDTNSPADEVRASNDGLEKFLAAGIGYALALPSEPVANAKMWFGEQYGGGVGALVSFIGEQRMLNPEIIAMAAQGVWLYRYCQTFSLSSLIQYGQLSGGAVAGIPCIEAYCRDRDIVNAAMPLMALEQIGKLVIDFNLTWAKDTANA